MDSVVALSDADFDESLRSADRPVAVIFGAAWSSPSRAIALGLADLAAKVGERVRIAALDIDENPEVARSMRIHALPTTAYFVAGKEQARTCEAMNLDECAAWIAEASGTAR